MKLSATTIKPLPTPVDPAPKKLGKGIAKEGHSIAKEGHDLPKVGHGIPKAGHTPVQLAKRAARIAKPVGPIHEPNRHGGTITNQAPTKAHRGDKPGPDGHAADDERRKPIRRVDGDKVAVDRQTPLRRVDGEGEVTPDAVEPKHMSPEAGRRGGSSRGASEPRQRDDADGGGISDRRAEWDELVRRSFLRPIGFPFFPMFPRSSGR